MREEATRRKTSKSSLVKELLERSLGLRTGGNLHDDYREFCGVWIAAGTMEHAAHLLSFDAHFAEIDGLVRVSLGKPAHCF